MFRTKLFRMTTVLAILVALVAVPMAAAQMEPGLSVEEGATLSGAVEIAGYASGNDFARWDLHLFPDGDDTAKIWLASGSDQGEFSESVDTTRFADGEYVLSLRVVDATTGNFTEYLVPVTIANAEAAPAEEEAAPAEEEAAPAEEEAAPAEEEAAPAAEETAAPVNGFDAEDGIEASGTVTVTGFADTPGFTKWQLDVVPFGVADDAIFAAVGTTAGEFSYALDSTNFPDGDHQLRLRVVNDTSNYDEYFVDLTVANAAEAAAEEPEVEASTAVTETAVTTDTVEAPAAEAPAAEETPATGLTVEEDAALSGTVDITGYASGNNFARWDLHLFPNGDDNAKIWLASGNDQGEFSESVDTTQFADGEYVLSLRVVDATTGNFTEYLVPVTIANAVAE